jgi:parallel beta-helix repeat protein
VELAEGGIMRKGFIKGAAGILTGIILLPAGELGAGTLVVTNTNDSGPGSLREVIDLFRNNGRDTIVFNIPTTDPGYNSTTGVWTIKPASGYTVSKGTTVDGTVVVPAAGGGNLQRPGIEIDGTDLVKKGITGLRLEGDIALRGLVVNHFQYGIWVSTSNVTIEQCFVGTDPTGKTAKPNGHGGILIIGSTTGVVIQENLISGNEVYGIRISGGSATGNVIRNNRIGTDSTGTVALPNGYAGICLHDSAHGNTVEQNLVSGNDVIGIELYDAGTNGNQIRENRVGTSADGNMPLPNKSFGVSLSRGPCDNTIGPGNRIAFNGRDGVLVDGSDSFIRTAGNTVAGNTITANVGKGIRNYRGGNAELAPPTINSATASQIAGTAGPDQTVDVYLDDNDEGAFFVGTTTADASGNFVLPVVNPLPGLACATAVSTDATGNTSEFSAPFILSGIEEEGLTGLVEFSLHQNYPNPFNASTKIVYSVPKTGRVRLAVYNMLGKEVSVLVDGIMNAGTHGIWFDALNFSSGIYVYRIEACGKVQSKKLILAM